MIESIPLGYCGCGCGGETRRRAYSSKSRGFVKGEFARFIPGHHKRLKQFQRQNPDWLVPPAIPVDMGHDTPCLIYQGYLKSNGYGEKWNGERVVTAHRFYYEQEHGPLPDDTVLDHKCRVPSCVNPKHVRIATRNQNAWFAPKPTARHSMHGIPRSRFKGVSWDRTDGNWRVRIKYGNRTLYVGNFADEAEAAIAYNEAALRCHGEFAWINQIG